MVKNEQDYKFHGLEVLTEKTDRVQNFSTCYFLVIEAESSPMH